MAINKEIKYSLLILLCLSLPFLSCKTMHSYNIYYNAREAYEGAVASKTPNKALLDECIEKCSKLLTYYPESKWTDDVIFLSGKCFFLKDEIDEAEQKFKELINFYPESEYVPEAEVFLGKIALEKGYDLEAEKWFSRASKDKDVKEEVDYWLTNAYFLSEDYDKAIDKGEEYLISFKNGKYKIEVLSILGESADSLAKYEEALKYYERVIPLVEDGFEYRLKTGDMHYKVGNITKAKEIFESIITDNEEEENALKDRIALCYEAEEDYENAIMMLEELDTQESRFHAGSIYEKQSKLKDALDAYNQALEKGPNTELGNKASKKVKAIKDVFTLWKALGIRDTTYTESAELDSSFILGDTLQPLSDTTGAFQVTEDSISGVKIDTLSQEMARDTLVGILKEEVEPDLRDTLFYDIDSLPLDLMGDTIENVYLHEDSASQFVSDTLLTLEGDSIISAITDQDTIVQPDTVLDVASARMRLAEIWLLEFGKVDEALKEYKKVVQECGESEQLQRAKYAIAWIEHNIKGSWESALSRYRSIEIDYPDTDYAIAARREIERIEKERVKRGKGRGSWISSPVPQGRM